VSARQIAADDELFTDYGATFWGPRISPQYCSICLEEEVYELQLWQCGLCAKFSHIACLKEHVRKVVQKKCSCPLDYCTCRRVPKCPDCRHPLPRELGHRRETCHTPGCSLPIWHDGHCESQPYLGSRRSETAFCQ